MGALEILKDLSNGPGGVVVPMECSLLEYFEEIRLQKRKVMFTMLLRVQMKEKNSDFKALQKFDLVQMAAQRVVFRYMFIFAVAFMCKNFAP